MRTPEDARYRPQAGIGWRVWGAMTPDRRDLTPGEIEGARDVAKRFTGLPSSETCRRRKRLVDDFVT